METTKNRLSDFSSLAKLHQSGKDFEAGISVFSHCFLTGLVARGLLSRMPSSESKLFGMMCFLYHWKNSSPRHSGSNSSLLSEGTLTSGIEMYSMLALLSIFIRESFTTSATNQRKIKERKKTWSLPAMSLS